ncbi:MAG: lamin tail domain-containing protein [Candidatus Hodarchaeota archaeon]
MNSKKVMPIVILFVMLFTVASPTVNANPSSTNIIITEVLYDTPGTDSVEEWVELYNPTGSTVDLAGWTLTDNVGTYTISSGTIPASGYYVIARDSAGFNALYGFDPDLSGMSLYLGNTGDQIILKDSSGTEVDFVAWEDYVSGWTVSAVYTTIRRISVTDTDTVADWENSGTIGDPGSGSYSHVLITEVLYDTPGTDSAEEWVELYNPTTSSVNLAGWTISDNVDTYTISSGTISAGGYFVLARESAGFNALYGSNPDLSGMTLYLSNSGDQLSLKDDGGAEIDFVAWENYVSGWDISATHTTIRRITAADTDTVADWENSGTIGDPGSGSYGDGGDPDTTPPSVTITNPSNGATVSGIVSVTADASDDVGVSKVEFYIDDVLKYTDSMSPYSYSWDTTSYNNGTHSIKAIAYDAASNSDLDQISVTVQNSGGGSAGIVKIMAYNIKESGESSTHPDWKEVVKEENADIIMFVETGYWDDNNDAKLNQYVGEFNSYFVNEDPYIGYTTQGITYSTSGEAIMSRYPVVSTNQITHITLDDQTSYDVTHDFFDVIVDIGGTNIHIIGAHLKAMTGSENEERREWEQEGIINYMDDLGNVPIMYLGDLNSFSPEDWGLNTLQSGLGYGPLSMMIPPYTNPETGGDYSQYQSTQHSWSDVHRVLNPSDLGITNPDYDSRIDFIYVNQLLADKIQISTTGDTAHAMTGSDHLSVDVWIDFSLSDITPPAQVTGLTATPISSTQIDLSWSANTEPDLDHYVIYRDGDVLTTTTASSYSDTGLAESTTYTYEVSAVDISSNEGLKSDPASDTTFDATPPAQVTGLTATAISGSQINLSWNANTEGDLDHYVIYRDGVILTTTTVTSYSDTGLDDSTTYTYEVSAVDTSGNEGLKSDPVSETTPDTTPPAQVTGLTATAVSQSQINLSWNANTEGDLNHYIIYRDGVFFTTTTATSYSDTGLAPGTTHTYEVSAVDNNDNEGQKSSPDSATTFEETSTILISEVYYDAVGTDSKNEWIELYNPGSTAVDISGWTLSDNKDTWTVPDGTVIQPGDYLIIARSSSGFNDLYGFNPDISGLSLALGNRGDSLTLKDSSGVEVDFVAWENYVSGWNIYASTGSSITRSPSNLDTDTVDDWVVTSNETPGTG